jgi:hypothetical protein
MRALQKNGKSTGLETLANLWEFDLIYDGWSNVVDYTFDDEGILVLFSNLIQIDLGM